MSLRRGHRQRIEAGVYRSHRVACPAADGTRRCSCPWAIAVPSPTPGSSTFRSLPGSLTLAAVRKARRRALAEGRLAIVPNQPSQPETLRAFTTSLFRAREAVLAPHTLREYDGKYRRWIDAPLGHLPLDAIDRRTAEAWLATTAGLATSRATVVGAHRVLRMILSAADEYGLIDANPAKGLRLPPADPDQFGARRVLSGEQLLALLTHPKVSRSLRVETLLRAAAEGGLRRSEVCGLRWPDVHLRNGRIEVRRGYGGRTTKGHRSRVVHIGETVAARLRAYRQEAVSRGASITGPVWPGRSGSEMFESSPTHICARALTDAGLVEGDGRPLVPLHGLRHTCASLMLAQGVPLIVVSRHLGHASPQTTARIYAHLIDDAQLAAAPAAFEAIYAENVPPS